MRRTFLKIAMVSAGRYPSDHGAPARICGLAQALARRGHEVRLLTHSRDNGPSPDNVPVHNVLRIGGHPIMSPSLPKRLFLLDPLLAIRLWRVVRRDRIDIIYAHRLEGVFISLIARGFRKVRLVYDIRGPATPPAGYRAGRPRFAKHHLEQWLNRAAAKTCDRIIAEVEALEDALIGQGIPAHKIDVIHTGVDPAVFDAGNAAVVAEKYGLKTKKVALYDAGTASPQAVNLIREITSEVLKEESEAVFFIVSDDADGNLSTLREEKSIKDNIIVTVRRPFQEMMDLTAVARVAVVAAPATPQTRQGLPCYMAARMAIVSLAGPAELITHGENGLIVENGNIRGAVGAIVSLLRDEEQARRLGEGARNSLVGKYEWSSLAEKAEAIFMKLLSGPR